MEMIRETILIGAGVFIVTLVICMTLLYLAIGAYSILNPIGISTEDTIATLGGFLYCHQEWPVCDHAPKDIYYCYSREKSCRVRALENNTYEEIECWTLEHLPKGEEK